jgi:hypothetical protein
MVLIQVPRGMTMPAQLTDAEFAVAKRSTEPRVRAEILREKKRLGSGCAGILGNRLARSVSSAAPRLNQEWL